MSNKPKKQKYYTFMVIPHDAQGQTFSLKVPHFVIQAAVLLSVFSLLLVGSSVVYSSLLSRRLVNYHKAIAVNRQQQAVINDFSLETQRVHKAISELAQHDNELRKLLGLKSWKSKITLSNQFEDKSQKVSYDLKMADRRIEENKASFDELKNWVGQVRQRFANTPSRWPLYGPIVSRFGYRVYPWRGFHTGLDIQAPYGVPIRAAAGGVVSYAGWRNGYGRTVMIDHGYGKETLYGHCSRLIVKVGQRVAKGEIVSYVGSTGYSTGPHLHYEVRNSGTPVNPIAYLDLNILSASKTWRN